MTHRLPLLLGAALIVATHAFAAGQATTDEAKAMALKAAAFMKSAGPEKAFAEFNAKDGPWHDRDLYVTVKDGQGVMVANGSNPGLIGKNVLDLKDADGKPFSRESYAIKDQGWVDYRWPNPLTKEIERKTQYVVHVDDYVVGVGAYAP